MKYVYVAVLLALAAVCVAASSSTERTASRTHAHAHAHVHAKHHRSKHMAKAKEDPAPVAANNDAAAANDANPASGATTKEQAEEKCAQAAAAGTLPDEAGAGASPDEQDGEVGAPVAQLDQGGPMIVLPDGTKMPIPSGCGPYFEAEVGGPASKEFSIPPGVGPCQACEGEEQVPLKEIQVLEWPRGKSQPIVIGKQLLTDNKTKLMLKVLTGEFDKIEADWKKKEAAFVARQNEIKQKQEDAVAEYAARVKEATKENADEKIESALARALDVWGLEQSYGQGLSPEQLASAPEGAMSPEEIAGQNAEEAIDTMAVAEAGPDAGADAIDEMEAKAEQAAQ